MRINSTIILRIRAVIRIFLIGLHQTFENFFKWHIKKNTVKNKKRGKM
jgi:hypothetical protein